MPAIRCLACGVTFINGLAYLHRTHECVIRRSKRNHPSNPKPAS
jgi:hypothetical protein